MNKIIYNLHLKSGKDYTFEVDIDRQDCKEMAKNEMHAFWTKLDYNQCSNCPLRVSDCMYCPVALDIEGVAKKFGDVISIEPVDVWVHTKDRSFFKNCSVQEALKSLFGLIMASGSCPILSRLKPLAYFHLPFATLDETVYHLVGAYLIKQHSIYCEGIFDPDWNLKGVEELYKQLETVNVHLINRLRDASNKDANLNALYLFMTLTSIVALDINSVLETIDSFMRKGL
ncbi:MAG: hypothetical protein DWB56_11155 [Candidatus Jettenia sp.]|uniref:Uncharacterized protein n=1 Tax=Candidatus Jettenia caeni TaxID=247490 RepID=I3IPJ8_9BACT|nr:hypothetical protein [Candidatus Jettenia sp. AMX1]MBC6929503.1 hypothetical protein [Candidatus Jettenia sp.]GAB63643.1 conserved hypothetical protein [Candidatus Jettenia caeni]KAA0249398.1 MAG: hypothetical protein EDM77_08975 [Candidatus Jettenia sp. AMX1]MCE7880931.1 hypothetical protein [Candidatus Jettenia sp. AMX1]MCQ3927668.1 hypothetical protein [Candidatus Jettenia sp.]